MSPEIIWSIIGIILVIVELLTVTFFSIFLAIGAFAAALSAFFTQNVIIHISVFIIFAALSFIFGKSFLGKFFKVNEEIRPSTINALLGKTGIVIAEIKEDSPGQVKVDGTVWTAIAEDSSIITEKSKVEVVKIDGVKLVVKTI